MSKNMFDDDVTYPLIPKMPFKITLRGGRKIFVHGLEENWVEDRSSQKLYSVTGLRSWTFNGEVVPEDVLKTLIAGAEKVEEDEKFKEY